MGKTEKEENEEKEKRKRNQRGSAILALGRRNRKLTQASMGCTRRLSQKNTIRQNHENTL